MSSEEPTQPGPTLSTVVVSMDAYRPRDQFSAMSEGELRAHMHETFNAMGYDDGLGAILHAGVEKAEPPELLKMARGLAKLAEALPDVLASTDQFITKASKPKLSLVPKIPKAT